MNCPQCKRLLYANQNKCLCGWAAPARSRAEKQERPFEKSDPIKARKAIDIISKAKGKMRRNFSLPGECLEDFINAKHAAVKSGKTIAQFCASRLFANGWSSNDERKFQHDAHVVAMRLADDEELINELASLELDTESRAEREEIQEE